MTYAERLKALRLKKGLSQAELAERLGVSQPLISQYENGSTSPTAELSVKIAELFGTTVERMVKGV